MPFPGSTRATLVKRVRTMSFGVPATASPAEVLVGQFSGGELLQTSYVPIGAIDAVHVEFRAAAGVREIEGLLHDGNGLAAVAGSLQTQGDNPSGGGDESLVARPIRSLQHTRASTAPCLA